MKDTNPDTAAARRVSNDLRDLTQDVAAEPVTTRLTLSGSMRVIGIDSNGECEVQGDDIEGQGELQ